ncbi:tRNA-dihydrouridine(47) synthase [NADP(+)]-like [Anaeramoeba ignava]|uniref:tRNA-dihydrouridine(47) synthase [NAD(P)(+)] n=1 Tax=Anaeramoeba ignava TaxID=1746090 RepID=A0A9Q0R676_ANAIG|nr:tRNA-dihydrouridine(47) synthase [NADP(+)]-like [Anaeramoeba ignava]
MENLLNSKHPKDLKKEELKENEQIEFKRQKISNENLNQNLNENLKENLNENQNENLKENLNENQNENLKENLKENQKENLKENQNLNQNLNENENDEEMKIKKEFMIMMDEMKNKKFNLENFKDLVEDPLKNRDTSQHQKFVLNKIPFDKIKLLRQKKYSLPNSQKINSITKEKMENQTFEEIEKTVLLPDPIRERKKIDFKGKIILAPLTTTGNLPFRRLCKEQGVDITIGEMAIDKKLLQGAPSEWALVKRHQSEDVFGVQLAGSNAPILTKISEFLEKELISSNGIDFIDLNCGCPIDLIVKHKMGSYLLNEPKRIERILKSMKSVISCPLTIKIRSGFQKKNLIAHSLVPKLKNWGADAVTLHGRTQQQRYTKLSDWDYINEIAKNTPDLPLIGNGDIFDYTQVVEQFELANVSSIMIGRGALIKPWIFREIKEKRRIDMSSSERLELYKKFVEFGLDHWGADKKGVDRTRKFFLEWLSFTYRYVPVGLLEVLPQKMNSRPQPFSGRNELESLFASGDPKDWVLISEMFLGPVGSGFKFEPKHQAKSWIN